MAGEIVGQEKVAGSASQGRVVDAGRCSNDARDPLDALGGEHPVEFAAGPAIAIGDQDAAIAIADARARDSAADGVGRSPAFGWPADD
jgi:hypothetical protein